MTTPRFHSWTPLLRRDGIIYIAEGVRDTGKSYPMLLRAMRRMIRNHRSMVWLRRTDVEVKDWLSTFGNAKWRKIAEQARLDPDKLRRQGSRILYNVGEDGGTSWIPLLRAGAVSGWADFRDTDDPTEELIYIDEAFATIERHRRYVGNEVEHALDILKSLRRGDGDDLRMVVAGNGERAANPWLDYFGVKKPRVEAGQIVPLRPAAHGGEFGVIWYEHIAPRAHKDGLAELLKGTGVGDFLEGKPKGAQSALLAPIPRNAHVYASVDFGRRLSIWVGKDGTFYVSTRHASGMVVVNKPNGNPQSVILTPEVRKNLIGLRQAWQRGRIRFDSFEAQDWGLLAIERIV